MKHAMNNKCPEKSTLTQWLSGSIADPDTNTCLNEHLETCVECQTALDRIEGELPPALAEILKSDPNDSFDNEPELADVISRVQALPTDRNEENRHRQLVKPGQRIRSYELGEKIGAGGMGEVFDARHTDLDKRVAIKFLPPDRLDTDAASNRFRRERKVLAQLDHPNVVRAIDAGQYEGLSYLVMEFIDGMDVNAICKQTKQVSVANACEITRQTAVGLQYICDGELIHRDIKPGNLIVDRSGIVKILDLGLAAYSQSARNEDLTSTSQLMGSLDYISPEQGRDTRNVDIRSDVFSLGATLFKMLTGKTIFHNKKLALEKLSALALDPIPSISTYRPDLPAGLIEIIDRMLKKNAADRYATPREVAEAIAPFCDQADLVKLLKELAGGHLENASASPTAAQVSTSLDAAEVSPSVRGEKTRSASQRPPIHWNWIGVGAALIAIALWAGITFFVPTKDGGVLQIEINDPAIKLSIEGQGDDIKIEDGLKTYVLKPGRHTMTVHYDDLKFESHELLIGKGSQLRVRVTYRDGRVVVKNGDHANSLRPLQQPGATTNEATNTPKETIHDSRNVAVWLLNQGFGLSTSVTARAKIDTLEDLPAEPFQITNLYILTANKEITAQMIDRIVQLPELTGLTIQRASLNPELLVDLHKAPRLRQLDLGSSGVTDQAVEYIGKCIKVKSLYLSKCPISNKCIDHILKIEDLIILDLSKTSIDDSGLSRLPNGLPNLIDLRLNSTKITNDSMQFVSGRRVLRDLELRATSVDGDGLAQLNRLPQLARIYLDFTPIDDAGLAHLANLPALSEVTLSSTAITDAGLAHLEKIPDLRLIDIRKTNISPNAVEAFRKRCPNVEVIH